MGKENRYPLFLSVCRFAPLPSIVVIVVGIVPGTERVVGELAVWEVRSEQGVEPAPLSNFSVRVDRLPGTPETIFAWVLPTVVSSVELERLANFIEILHPSCIPRLRPRRVERGEDDRGEQANDSDYDEELDEGEGAGLKWNASFPDFVVV